MNIVLAIFIIEAVLLLLVGVWILIKTWRQK